MRRWWPAVVALVAGLALGVAVAGLPRVGAERTRLITSASSSTTPTTGAAPDARAADASTTSSTTAPTQPLRPPGQVRVRPYNSTTRSGVTSATFDRLAAAGYAMVPGAFGPKDHTATTRIRFHPGFEREALAVAQMLGLPASSVAPVSVGPALDGADEADVVVLVGDDLASG